MICILRLSFVLFFTFVLSGCSSTFSGKNCATIPPSDNTVAVCGPFGSWGGLLDSELLPHGGNNEKSVSSPTKPPV